MIVEGNLFYALQTDIPHVFHLHFLYFRHYFPFPASFNSFSDHSSFFARLVKNEINNYRKNEHFERF
jgi:hypothetical protein